MATTFASLDQGDPAGRAAAAAERRFFGRLALGLALFIVVAFAQFDARFVDVAALPWVAHAHALTMVAWLALLVAQPILARSGNVVLHRRLGWLATGLVAAIVVFALMVVTTALRANAVPPFFTPAYFLALVVIEIGTFAALVAWAVVRRGDREWHRRLMIAATFILLEPALGRALPMPLLGDWGQWLSMVIQLGAIAILVGHDRRTLGRVHPATVVAAGAVVATHVAVTLAAMAPPVIALARGIAA
ncbi:hypothetical protein ACFO0A_01685 [Novosphingobium tardum]|uniref:Adenylate cyclase n=1 Tax=Novosphingobium tardum TaxID=1538021 RepID=A0ABV8RK38_9SPHN